MIFICILLTDCNYFYVLLAVENVGIRSHTASRKQVYIPYLDNIEITSIKIFLKTTEISGKIKDLWYNRLFSVVGSSLIYDRILWDKKKREFEGTLFYNLRKVVK